MEDKSTQLIKLYRRLGELEGLKTGWAGGGEGLAVSRASIENAGQAVAMLICCHGIPKPHVYPTPEGKIQIEWVFYPWAIDVQFGETQMDCGATNVNDDLSFTADRDVVIFHPHPIVERLEAVEELAKWLKEMIS